MPVRAAPLRPNPRTAPLKEAAALAGITPETARKWVAAGTWEANTGLALRRIGWRYYVLRAELDEQYPAPRSRPPD